MPQSICGHPLLFEVCAPQLSVSLYELSWEITIADCFLLQGLSHSVPGYTVYPDAVSSTLPCHLEHAKEVQLMFSLFCMTLNSQKLMQSANYKNVDGHSASGSSAAICLKEIGAFPSLCELDLQIRQNPGQHQPCLYTSNLSGET